MMNSIEDYQSLIELLKNVLEFYANSSNYACHMGNPSSIDLDENGSQARFALAKIEEMKTNNQKILDDYVNFSEKMLDGVENKISNGDLDTQELLKTIKNLNDENIDI